MPQETKKMVAQRGFLYRGQRIMRGQEVDVYKPDVSWLSVGKAPLATLAGEKEEEKSDDGFDIDGATKAELEKEVEKRGLTDEVEGTGANGNVVMEDLRRTLRADS